MRIERHLFLTCSMRTITAITKVSGYRIKKSLHLFNVHVPTRGGNILDLILSTEQNMVENVEVVESLGSSDHNSIEFSVITQVQLKESKESVPDL